MQQRHFEDYGKYPAKSSLTVNIVNRSRQSRYPMLPVEDALKIVFEELKTCSRQSTLLPVDLATNYVLTDPICSPKNLPAFPASVKDGYAVIAADGAGHRKVLDSKTSSDYDDIVLQPGYCKRVNTGAPLTKGADAVVEVEQTELVDATGNQENIIIIKKAPQVGQDVRQIGFDVSLGECILNSGYRLASSEIIVSSGDEICEHSVDPLPIGKVRDTNRPMLLSLMKEHGFNAEDLGIVRDEPDNILSLFREAFKRADVVVSSGGMSMGDRDLLKEVLIHDLGFQLHFGRMFMKPGKPTAFMTGHLFNRKKFYFGLPGNPVSAWVTAHICVLPALFRMEGQHCDPFPIVSVTVGDSYELDPRPEYVRALYTTDGGSKPWHAKIFDRNQSSSRLMSIRHTNMLLILPPRTADRVRITAGDIVRAMVIRSHV
uniref:molybdopterin adenylyltransferase n=1 Tax=Trichuris muris TaxID=70415 RepID=A0A5S6R129_TRIMR